MSFEKKIFECIDLTSLNDHDTEATIADLCKKAVTTWGHVAAVCVYPKFVKQAKQCLQNTPVKIATVANFPHGTDSVSTTIASIQQSIEHGAQEVDVVFPYHDFLKGDSKTPKEFIQACKNSCVDKVLLKVILETGAIKDLDLIAQAARDVLEAGADFIKTSTGKISVGATPETAEVMLRVLCEYKNSLVGFKASGGIRTLEQAMQYVTLAESIMGKNWISPAIFRIGASQLVDVILNINRETRLY